MKKNIIFLILFGFLSHAFASSEETYKNLGLPPGTVKILSETSENCADGPFKIVGVPEDEVLMLGSKITLPLPNKDQSVETIRDSHQCKEDVQSQFVQGQLHVLTTVHSCPPKLKRMESRVEEIVSIKDHQITYKRLAKNEFRIQCVFEWSPEVDKKNVRK